MIKLAVFDWNGTLFADALACVTADNHVLKVFGGESVNLKIFRETFTIPVIDFYILRGCNREELVRKSALVGKVFHESYEAQAVKVRSRAGAKEVLKWLFKNKIKSIILSNHTVSGVEFQLKRLGFERYIDSVLANTALDSATLGRNKEEKLATYMKSNKLKESEVVIIGDSPEEIEIGKNLEIRTIAITYGYYSTARLRKCQPDFLIGNLMDLIEIFKEL